MKSIKKIGLFLLFILIGFVQKTNGQSLPGSEPDIKNPLDIIQASPTANSLGQYGGVNVGLASGTVNKSIDLYNFVSGSLQVPISINYSSNGLKVNDNGGIIGTGWSANMGGVIRRTVMGEDDERNTTRLPSTFNPYGGDEQTYNYITGMISYNVTASVYDGEPDIFSFNFGNYAGKFIFDNNGNLVLLNYSGLKIIRVSRTNFEIYTPDGVKYEFGGPAVEYSYKMGSGCGKVFADPTNTAFFLYKITHPDGSIINLIYDVTNYSYVTGLNETYSYLVDHTTGLIVTCNSETPDYARSSCASIMYTQTYLLKELNSNVGKVQFSYADHSAQDGKILKDIRVYSNGYTNPIRKIVLNYLENNVRDNNRYYPSSIALSSRDNLGFRSFLTEIQMFDSSGTIDSRYKFAYKDLNALPKRFANCQDYFGYFNGKSNTTLIPKPENTVWAPFFSDANANRAPDEAFMTAGMLSKITYPTGGFDSLIYEANTTWKEYIISSPLINEVITATGVGPLGTGSQTTSIFTVSFQQKVKFSFFCEILATDGTYPGTGRVILLKNGVSQVSSNVQAYNSDSFEAILDPGNNYQLRVEAGKGDKVSCTASYSYKSAPDTKSFKNQVSAGVRIWKVITGENGSSHEKKYSYYKIDDIDKKSTGNLNSEPYFERFTTGRYLCNNPELLTPVFGVYHKYILSSNTILGDSFYDSAPQYYSDVFEENNQGNGGVVYKFIVNPNSRPQLYLGEEFSGPWTSNSFSNGLETDRLIFKRNDNLIIPVKRTSTSYKSDPAISNTYRAFVANQRYIPVGYDQNKWETLDLLEYDHLQRWVYADSVNTKEYASNGIDYTETIDAFFYDNPSHALLSRKTRLDSKTGRNVTHFLYPGDYASGEVFINDMITAKLIGYPIENVSSVELGSNKSVISGTLTKYKTGGKGLVDSEFKLNTSNPVPLTSFRYSNRPLGIAPPNGTATAFSADSRYEKEYQIFSYDINGRPRELKKLEEPNIVYLWGYNGIYPVMEIKNSTYEEVKTVLTQAVIDNLNAANQTEATMETLIKNAADKLRGDLRVAKAMVTSYTYKPLVGMTSQTDAKGQTTYYEYDEFQRLKNVKDQNGNILKNNVYHFKP